MTREPVEVETTRLGRDGDGLAETADGVLAIPGALSGERVRVDPSATPPALLAVVRAGDARVSPPCRHAEQCGGCRLQHAALGFLADWRGRQVADALQRRGIETEIQPTRQSPPRSRRRVGFTALRAKKGVRLGFRQARSHVVVDVDDCLIAHPEIMAAASTLRELAVFAAPRSRAISCYVTTSLDGLDLVVDDAKALTPELLAMLVDWSAKARAGGASIARVTWNGETALQESAPRQAFGRGLVAAPPGGFLQATLEGEAALTELVREGVAGASRVADLFSGCGTFALSLAESAEVLAIDADAAAVAALDRGWREASGLKRVAAVARDLFRRPLLASEFKGLDAVVFDPPRAGAEAQAQEIARSTVARVIGVSCNPASFARDAEILRATGFALERVTPVDQFLWSPHVELVGVFSR